MNTARIQSPFGFTHRFRRLLWSVVCVFLFRPCPRLFFGWRRLLLIAFGARIDPTARVYGTARIWAPWNLVMGPHSILADHVDCYNVARVTLEEEAIVSQHAYLCTASHDVHHADFPLVTKPITLERGSWVCARAILGPGVTVGEGAVLSLGSVVVKPVVAWSIVGGNPAKEIGQRTRRADAGNTGRSEWHRAVDKS
jgi:putative colanic acid biosynthesis acetyltransferase WcaF